jgi:hypothetical protein
MFSLILTSVFSAKRRCIKALDYIDNRYHLNAFIDVLLKGLCEKGFVEGMKYDAKNQSSMKD